MKVRDEDLWEQQRAELREDEVGKDFLTFVESWVDRAEVLMGEDSVSAAKALRASLLDTDTECGRVSVHFLGQMLVVIATHWNHGEDVIRSLTSIELRLVQDMLALKFSELEKQAEDMGNA